MANYSPDELGKILAREDLSWFTVAIKGRLYRYVVAFTDNIDPSLELLSAQARFFDFDYDPLTLWWRLHPDGKNRIDIWTSSRDIEEMIRLGKLYKQHSIRDLFKDCDVKIE